MRCTRAKRFSVEVTYTEMQAGARGSLRPECVVRTETES
jgi:hypothetical protein